MVDKLSHDKGFLAIHQPNLFPRLKVIQKIALADQWIVLDDVQYVVREWQNRAYIRHLRFPEKGKFITIPVHRPYGRQTLINQVEIAKEYKSTRLLNQFREYYGKSPYWNQLKSFLEIDSGGQTRLIDVTLQSTIRLLSALGVNTSFIASSSLDVKEKRTERLVCLCEATGFRSYISGSGGRLYLKESIFRERGIVVRWQKWCRDDWSNVSSLDFIARFGLENARKVLSENEFGDSVANNSIRFSPSAPDSEDVRQLLKR